MVGITASAAQPTTGKEIAVKLNAGNNIGAIYLSQQPLTDAAVSLESLKSVRSILCAHIVKTATPILCIYWRSRDEYECDHEAALKELSSKFAADPTTHGLVSGFISPRRIRWYSVVTAILALVGAVESTRHFFYRIFEPAEVLLTAGRAGAINYFPEQQLFESLKITSRVPVEQRVRVEKIHLRPKGSTAADPIPATFEPHSISGLGSDQSETVQFSLPLPEAVGEYEVIASTRSKAGWLWPWKPQTYFVPVHVWSPVPRAAFVEWARELGSVGTARYRIDVGYAAPAGLDCTAGVIGSPPEVIAIIPNAAGVHDVSTLSSSGQGKDTVVSVRWTTRPLPEFASTTVVVVYQAQRPVSWASLPRQQFFLDCSLHAPSARES